MQSPLTQFNNRTSALYCIASWFDNVRTIFLSLFLSLSLTRTTELFNESESNSSNDSILSSFEASSNVILLFFEYFESSLLIFLPFVFLINIFIGKSLSTFPRQIFRWKFLDFWKRIRTSFLLINRFLNNNTIYCTSNVLLFFEYFESSLLISLPFVFLINVRFNSIQSYFYREILVHFSSTNF